MSKENLVGTSVRVPQKVLDRLEAASRRTKWTKGELHRQALEFYLGVLESGHFLAPIVNAPFAIHEQDRPTDEPPEFGFEQLTEAMGSIVPSAWKGGLVTFRELREACPLSAKAFDKLIRESVDQGKLSLHMHDFPSRMTDQEKAECHRTPNGWAVGCAIPNR